LYCRENCAPVTNEAIAQATVEANAIAARVQEYDLRILLGRIKRNTVASFVKLLLAWRGLFLPRPKSEVRP
jgi:hypothetical protein